MKSERMNKRPRMQRLFLGIAMSLIAFSMMSCSVFKRKVVVIPQDRAVQRMPANKVFTPEIPGWFVPDARMQEIVNELKAKS